MLPDQKWEDQTRSRGDILGIFVIWCGMHMVGFIIATVEIKTTDTWSSIFCLLGAEFYCVSMVEISIKESLNERWFCLRDEQEKKNANSEQFSGFLSVFWTLQFRLLTRYARQCEMMCKHCIENRKYIFLNKLQAVNENYQ